MFYALAHKEDELKDSLKKAIQTAPCTVCTGLAKKDGTPDVAGYEATEWHYFDMGIWNVGGPNWDKNLKLGCDTFGQGWCAYSVSYTHLTLPTICSV